jgi:holo-[acyl-carrier protein] synthase
MRVMPFRVGVDLVAVEAIRASIATHAERYLTRVYTEREIADCTTSEGVNAERLAARFAAKEAALKVLRPGEVGLSLRSIEVRRSAGGWVELELSGPAAALALEAGLQNFALSLTHEGEYASAVVIADLHLRNGPSGPMMGS